MELEMREFDLEQVGEKLDTDRVSARGSLFKARLALTLG